MFTTMDCNMVCSYCYVKNKGKKYMNMDTAIKAIDFAISLMKPEEHLNIQFQGGEPTLNWSVLEKTVSYCKLKSSKFGFAITTNGILLDLYKMEYLGKNGFHLRLSLDGAENSNDKNRKFKNKSGTYSHIKNALKLFKKYYCGRKFIRMTICENNASILYDDLIFLLEQGIYDIVISLNVQDEWTDSSLNELNDCLSRLADYYIKSRNAKKSIRISFFDDIIQKVIVNKELSRGSDIIETKNESFCGLGCRSFAISPDGNIFSCSLLVGDDNFRGECLGSVFEEKISIPKFNYNYKEQTVCKDCKLQFRCYNNCVMLNRYATGSYYTPSHFQCWFQKSLIINADRIINALMGKNISKKSLLI